MPVPVERRDPRTGRIVREIRQMEMEINPELLAELDAISYVGPAALSQLLAWPVGPTLLLIYSGLLLWMIRHFRHLLLPVIKQLFLVKQPWYTIFS